MTKVKKPKQLQLLKPHKSDHGGSIQNPKKRARPLSTKETMHLVLKSSVARGPWSFKKNKKEIDKILHKFADKHHIQIKSYANVGNHLHLHIKLFKRRTYTPFIRAITCAIMMKVTGFCRDRPKPPNFNFWDYRPFSRVIQSFQAFKNLVSYIEINTLEGLGYSRQEARAVVGQPLVDRHSEKG